MAVGSLAYVFNDTAVRLASEQGLGVYQVLCLRGLLMIGLFGAVALLRRERPRRVHFTRPVIVRVLAEMIATVTFFAALVRMDFANAQAILQIAPLAVTMVAAGVLGERVTRRQYAAILTGFVGVVLIIRPATESFTIWSLLVVGSVGAMVVRELATRDVDASVPALSIALMTAVGNTVLTGGLAASSWGRPTGVAYAYVALAATLLFFGYLFTIQTVRIGDLSVSAPFRYLVLVGAVLSGFFIFDEALDTPTIMGILLILGSGLYSIALERRGSLSPVPD